MLEGWTEYCSELYNHQLDGDPAVLHCQQATPGEDPQSIQREEVEVAVKALKQEKSAGIDNIPAEMVQAEGETMITTLTAICNNIWRTGIWPTSWSQSMIITLPTKENLQLCKNYRAISLIIHPNKAMLKMVINRLKPVAETIIADQQAGFRAGRSTTEQMFNLKIIWHLQTHEDLRLYSQT